MRTLAALLFVCAVVRGQSTGRKDCSVDGSVVNSATGSAIPRAHVSVVGADESALVDSDAAGRWKVEHVACGRVTISVNRVGFLRNQQNPGPPPVISLVANVPLHDVKLELSPQAVLAGRVLDDQGDPIQGAQVSLMTSRVANGVRGLQASTSTISNDLGEYRFAGLTAGKYILCANAGGAGTVVANGAKPYGEKCYPGPVDAGAASTMNVGAGYEGRIDFTLTPLSTAQVSGLVSGRPEGVNSTVSLVPRAQFGRMFMGLSAPVRPDGSFLVRNVPSGSYTLAAISLQPRLTARVPVEVGGNDVGGIQVRLEPGVSVTGTVKVVSTTGRKIEKPQYTVILRSSDAAFGPGQNGWDENKTSFTVTDVLPGSYHLDFSAPAPFYMKSATMGGRDIAGSEVMIGSGAGNIEVVLSDDGGAVEGDVSTDDGPTAAWIFLEKRDGAPPRNGRTDANGHFKIDTIPPGDYRVYAWDDNSKVEYGNPEWMRRNGKGVAVTVQPGQTAQVKLIRQIAPSE